MQPKDRILVALDTRKPEDFIRYARTLGDQVGGFKIGLEALLSIGLKDALNMLRGYGPASENIFVDAKIHDIPNTMAGAVRAVVEHPQVKFVNVHASAGAAGMRAAAEAVTASNAETRRRVRLLAVTVLTSMDRAAARAVYGKDELDRFGHLGMDALVQKFAVDAHTAGCRGVVCSPKEIGAIRMIIEDADFALVTPGVRPAWASADDQKRVMTPGEAVKAGATYLVIGRPITKPPEQVGSPAAAAKLIAEEIGAELAASRP